MKIDGHCLCSHCGQFFPTAWLTIRRGGASQQGSLAWCSEKCRQLSQSGQERKEVRVEFSISHAQELALQRA